MKTTNLPRGSTLLRSFGIYVVAALAALSVRPSVQAQVNPPAAAPARADDAGAAVTIQFGEGWYPEETLPNGPTRWMSGAGRLDVTARRAGTLVTKGRIRSYMADNSAELLVDEKVVQTIRFSGEDWQEFVLSIPLSAGTHRLRLRSHQAGKQPPHDNRIVTICVENFQAHLEP